MEDPPPLVQQAAIGDLLGEGMLEGVDQLGKQTHLVQKLGILEMHEPLAERPFRKLHHGLEEDQGTSVPMTAAVWSRDFSSGGRRSMRVARTACTVAGTWQGEEGVRQAIGARLAHQSPGLYERPHALLQEEGITLGALDQEWIEGCQARVVSQEGLQEDVGTRWGQGVQPQLRVVGLTPPAVPIVGTIVDQEEQTRRREALAETLEECLGLGIEPVQILNDQQQGLQLALTQQHPLERHERALAGAPGHRVARRGYPRAGRPAAPGALE